MNPARQLTAPDDVSRANESRPECPLCSGKKARVTGQLSGAQLRKLWKETGKEFSSEAWGRIDEQFVVFKRSCVSCGFTFFDPGLAGNEAFYNEVDHKGYYTPDRPEFARTVRFASRRGLRSVLDVGCGSGAFLDLARQAGLETYGLELSGAAARKARDGGHRVFNKLLHEFDLAQAKGGFDLITLFQVLEHLENPVEVMQQAAALLRSGGCIAVAVPSEKGSTRFVPFDPHQWPPHHVSRWQPEDFAQLARAAHLRVIRKGGDLLGGAEFAVLWEAHNRLAPLAGHSRRAGSLWLVKMAGQIYRKTGMKFVFPRWGHSIYAYFQSF